MKGKNLHCVCSVQLNPPVNSSKFIVKACLLFMTEFTEILLHTVKPKIKVFFKNYTSCSRCLLTEQLDIGKGDYALYFQKNSLKCSHEKRYYDPVDV